MLLPGILSVVVYWLLRVGANAVASKAIRERERRRIAENHLPARANSQKWLDYMYDDAAESVDECVLAIVGRVANGAP